MVARSRTLSGKVVADPGTPSPCKQPKGIAKDLFHGAMVARSSTLSDKVVADPGTPSPCKQQKGIVKDPASGAKPRRSRTKQTIELVKKTTALFEVPVDDAELEEPVDEAEAEAKAEEEPDDEWAWQKRLEVARAAWTVKDGGSPGDLSSASFDPMSMARQGELAERLPLRRVASVLEVAGHGPLTLCTLANLVRWVFHTSVDREGDLTALLTLLLRPKFQMVSQTHLVSALSAVFGPLGDDAKNVTIGELASAALVARQRQRVLFTPKPVMVSEVAAAMEEYESTTGDRKTHLRSTILQHLFGRSVAENRETWHLVHILRGHLGFSTATVLKAFAHAFAFTGELGKSQPVQAESLALMEDAVARAHAERGGQPGALMRALLTNSMPAALCSACAPSCGIQVLPMKTEVPGNMREALDRLGGGAVLAEWMLDGDRAQVHVKDAGALVEVFVADQGRCLDRVEEVAAALQGHLQGVEDCILEVVLMRPPRMQPQSKKRDKVVAEDETQATTTPEETNEKQDATDNKKESQNGEEEEKESLRSEAGKEGVAPMIVGEETEIGKRSKAEPEGQVTSASVAERTPKRGRATAEARSDTDKRNQDEKSPCDAPAALSLAADAGSKQKKARRAKKVAVGGGVATQVTNGSVSPEKVAVGGGAATQVTSAETPGMRSKLEQEKEKMVAEESAALATTEEASKTEGDAETMEPWMTRTTVVVFDILALNGKSLTRLSLRERRAEMLAAVCDAPFLKLARSRELDAGAATEENVKTELDAAMSAYYLVDKIEKASVKASGLILKRLDGPESQYVAGRRWKGWQLVQKPHASGPEADALLFACLEEAESACLPKPEEFHFCVVSARRTQTPEGVQDVLNVEGQLKAGGVTPRWYVDAASLEGYRGLGLDAVVGGKLLPARNMALDDASALGKVCVQVSDDIGRWEYFKGPILRKKTLNEANAAAKCAECLQISPVAAAQFILAKMRGSDKKPQLGGVYPLRNMGQCFCTDAISLRNFILGDFFVVDKASCRFDPSMTLKEDYDFTCSHLQAHGSVLRCNRLIIHAKHETNAGGACSIRDPEGKEERMNISILQKKWPGAFSLHPTRPNQVVLRWAITAEKAAAEGAAKTAAEGSANA